VSRAIAVGKKAKPPPPPTAAAVMTGAAFTIGLGMLEHRPRRPGAGHSPSARSVADRIPARAFGRPRRALSGPSWRLAARAVIKAEAAAAAAPGGGAADTGLATMALTVLLGRWSLYTTAHPLHSGFAKIIGTSISEPTM
jgi:hypothetical protein